MQFDGVDDQILSEAAVTVTSHTLEAWFRNGETTGEDPIVGLDNGDAGAFSAAFIDNGVLKVRVRDSGGNVKEIHSSITVNNDDWNHVAYSYDAASDTIKLFVGGVEDTAATVVSNDALVSFTITAAFHVGVSNVDGAGLENFRGGIDEARVWDTALDAATILNGFPTSPTGAAANLLIAYDFENFDGSTALNLADGGTALNGAATGGPMTIHSATALEFDGSTTYVDTGVSDLPGSFTLSAWVFVDDAASGQQIILSKNPSGADPIGGHFGLAYNSGTIIFGMGNGSSVDTLTASGLTPNTWIHVTATYNNSNGAMELFVNGNSQDTGTLTGNARQISADDIEIGRLVDNTGTSSFDGAIRDVAIYSDVLGSGVILNLPEQGPTISTDSLIAYYPFSNGAGRTITDVTGRDSGNVSGTADWVFDTPVVGSSSTLNIYEDTPFEFFVPALDPDATGTPGTGITYSANDPANGTITAGTEGFVYTPDANYNGVDTVTITATDTDGGTATKTITITVGAVADASQFSGDATLTNIVQDDANPSGATVSTLFSALYSDPDGSETFAGVAVVVNPENASEGAWQVSLDSGSTWGDIGTASFGSAVMLDTAALVRFLPANGYSGTPTPLQVLPVDSDYGGVFSDFSEGLNIVTQDAH